MPEWKNGAFPMLSELGARTIAVECEQCDRRGRYRADRLRADFGDISQVEVLELIAKRGGCLKATFPPHSADLLYADKRCKIHLLVPGNKTRPPVLGTGLANGWRLFVMCERHHQGLKAVKPCKGEPRNWTCAPSWRPSVPPFPLRRSDSALGPPAAALKTSA